MFFKDPRNWVVMVIFGIYAGFMIYVILKGRKK
jgi:hypothetical protein